MLVLFDANALMIPVQFGVDIFTGVEELVGAFEPVTLEDVKDELTGLSRGRGRDAAAARWVSRSLRGAVWREAHIRIWRWMTGLSGMPKSIVVSW